MCCDINWIQRKLNWENRLSSPGFINKTAWLQQNDAQMVNAADQNWNAPQEIVLAMDGHQKAPVHQLTTIQATT